MDEKELRRWRRYFIASWLLFLLSFLGAAYLLSQKLNQINRYATHIAAIAPVKGDKGDPGVVDYQKVSNIVQQQVSNIPQPADGSNGLPGINGLSIIGPQGPAGKDGINGRDGVDGKNGQDGASAREIELCKIKGTGELGQRYVGSLNCNPIEE